MQSGGRTVLEVQQLNRSVILDMNAIRAESDQVPDGLIYTVDTQTQTTIDHTRLR